MLDWINCIVVISGATVIGCLLMYLSFMLAWYVVLPLALFVCAICMVAAVIGYTGVHVQRMFGRR